MADTKVAAIGRPADLIPIAEAAALVDRSAKTLRAWIKKKRLRGWKKLGRWHVSRAELEAVAEWEPVEPSA